MARQKGITSAGAVQPGMMMRLWTADGSAARPSFFAAAEIWRAISRSLVVIPPKSLVNVISRTVTPPGRTSMSGGWLSMSGSSLIACTNRAAVTIESVR